MTPSGPSRCFVVRREHRREGLNARLLDAAVEHARKHGARLIEAYPIDPDVGTKKPANDLYHGVVVDLRRCRIP